MKHRVIRCAAVCLLLLSVLCALPGCTASFRLYSRTSLDYFDTVCTLSGYAESEAEFAAAADGVFAVLADCHREFDVYNEYEGCNNLATVNRLAGTPVVVSSRLMALLQYAKTVYTMTDGAVNPAMGSVLSLWHTAREDGTYIPGDADLQAAAAHTSLECVVLDAAAGTVCLTDADASLDFGAVAKGFAADMAASWLAENGYTGYAVNLGGNIITVGKIPGDKSWTVGIENPSGGNYCTFCLDNCAVATSGAYQRYYVVDGVTYHHIIDPATLYPADSGYVSVTVVSPDAALADALSTALFILPYEAGLSLAESMSDVEAFWAFDDGTCACSSGWQTLMNDRNTQ